MKKWILRRPQMLSGLPNPSFGSGVALQLLIALMIYIAFNKASVPVTVIWMLGLVFREGLTSTEEIIDALNASQGLIIFSLFFTAVLIVFTLIYLRGIEKRPLSAAGISRRRAVPRYLAGFGIGAAALLLCYSLPLLSTDITYAGFTVFVPIYLAAFIIQSSSEELLFRGMLVPGLSRRIGLLPAVLISSALFSVAHALNGGYSLLGGIYYLLIGAFLALLMLRTDSLWASCGFHGAWNFTIGLLLPMSVSGFKIDYAIFQTDAVIEEAEATFLGDPYYLVFIGVFSALIAALLFAGKNRLVVRAPLPSQGAESTPGTPAPQPPPYYPQTPPPPYFPPAPGMPYYPPQPGQMPPAAPYFPPQPGQVPPAVPYFPPTTPPGAPYNPYYPPTQPLAEQQPLEETPYSPPTAPPTAPTPGAPYYPYYPPAQPKPAPQQPLEETPDPSGKDDTQ